MKRDNNYLQGQGNGKTSTVILYLLVGILIVMAGVGLARLYFSRQTVPEPPTDLQMRTEP